MEYIYYNDRAYNLNDYFDDWGRPTNHELAMLKLQEGIEIHKISKELLPSPRELISHSVVGHAQIIKDCVETHYVNIYRDMG